MIIADCEVIITIINNATIMYNLYYIVFICILKLQEYVAH